MSGQVWATRRLALAGIAIAGAAVIATGILFDWSVDFSIEGMEQAIRSWGMWGVVGSIALMVLHSFIPFPAEIIAIANGMVYGPIWGTAITWSGAMLGALLAFGLARKFGRPFVERFVSRGRWQSIDNWAAAQGGRVVLLARFFPVIAFNLINYAAGLSRISWWTFTWATGVGILPLTVVMVAMGDRVEVLPWWIWPIAIIAMAVAWYVFRHTLHPPTPRTGGRADAGPEKPR